MPSPANFSGKLLAPSHEDFSAARRIWNGMINQQPALIARCTSAQDVIFAIWRGNRGSPTGAEVAMR
jgi:hypothetical protein